MIGWIERIVGPLRLASAILALGLAAGCGGNDPTVGNTVAGNTEAGDTGTGDDGTASSRTGTDAATATSTPPPLPEVSRIDAIARFAELAAQAPEPLDEDRATVLRDLIETAWLPDFAPPRLASRAAESLLDEEGIDRALEANLHHEHPDVRVQCAWNLAQRGVTVALPHLIRQVRRDTDPRAQLWISDAMWRLGCDTGLPFYTRFFTMPAVAEEAGRSAIARIERAGLELPETPGWADLDSALTRIHDHWTLHGQPLVGDDQPGPPPIDEEAMQGRLAWHLEHLPEFQLREVDIARAVLRSLGRVGVPLLRDGLRGENRYARFHTLEMVNALGPCVPDLGTEVLALLDDPICGALAMRTIGEMMLTGAWPHVIARIDADDPEMRVAALAALGGLGDPRAVPLLEDRMQSEAAPMDDRVWAAWSLALLVRPGDADKDAEAGTAGGGEGRDPGLGFLREALASESYHAPTLNEMIDRVAARRRLIDLKQS